MTEAATRGKTRGLLSALVEAALPSDAAAADIAETERRVAAYVAGMRPPAALLLRALLLQLELCPLEAIGCPARFSRLAIDDRRRVLAVWERSPLYLRRAGAQALKGATLMFYYGIAGVAAGLEAIDRDTRGRPC